MSRKEISSLLMNLGMSPHMRGFDYIIDAVEMIYEDREVIYSITKRLYSELADKYNSKSSNIERCIRNAIVSSLNHIYTKEFEEIFGKAFNRTTGIPTNSEYISALVEYIRYDDK